MNITGTRPFHWATKRGSNNVLRRVLRWRPKTGRQTVAARVFWQREAAKPGEVLEAKSPPPAQRSVESSRQLHPALGGEGPLAAGRLRRAGQDRSGHGTPRARANVACLGVVLCPPTTGPTKELIGTPTDLGVGPSQAHNPKRHRPTRSKTQRGARSKKSRARCGPSFRWAA